MTLIDSTLSNVRRFYSSMGNPSDMKGFRIRRHDAWKHSRCSWDKMRAGNLPVLVTFAKKKKKSIMQNAVVFCDIYLYTCSPWFCHVRHSILPRLQQVICNWLKIARLGIVSSLRRLQQLSIKSDTSQGVKKSAQLSIESLMRAACKDNYSNLYLFPLIETYKSTMVNSQLFVQTFEVSKRAGHKPGFYVPLSDFPVRVLGLKFRIMAKPAFMGVFVGECWVAKAEYFVQR